MSEVRKLAAILAADVVGYSRLMGEDEAGTVKAGARASRGGNADRARGSLGGRLVDNDDAATACCWSFRP